MAGGLGMGVGKEKDWTRKNKVVPCKSRKNIVSVLTKKDQISEVKTFE